MTEQTLDFTVDPAILHSIIQSQAGTLSKALLEGVMNSIDAGATSLSVTLTADTFSLVDDGRGFQSRDEIEKWFRKFGTPHEEGDATYGRFRMGRGQMMAFAANTWRTGTFEMRVDVKNKGLGFVLSEKLRPARGCRITGNLYQVLGSGDLDDCIADFTAMVRFAQIPVRLNGKVVSRRPEDLKWDLETDDAYIKVDRESDKPLKVYNLGVLVREYSTRTYGCGGVVVSKKPLQVNFARNDILTSSCPVWARVSEFVKKATIQKVANKGSLSTGERSFLARQFLYGALKSVDVDPLDLKLITDITGRHHSVRDLMRAPRISLSSRDQGRTGSQLHRQGAAFMLSQGTLDRFSAYSVGELLSSLREVTGRAFPEAIDFATVAEGFSENFTAIADSALEAALAPEELQAFRVVQAFHSQFYAWYHMVEKSCGIRDLKVGSSNVAKAWTDGSTYITLDTSLLSRAAKRGAAGFMDLLGTLLHEYVHDEADLESHDHARHFYNKYHDALQGGGSGQLLTLAISMEKALAKGTSPAKRSSPSNARHLRPLASQRQVQPAK